MHFDSAISALVARQLLDDCPLHFQLYLGTSKVSLGSKFIAGLSRDCVITESILASCFTWEFYAICMRYECRWGSLGCSE